MRIILSTIFGIFINNLVKAVGTFRSESSSVLKGDSTGFKETESITEPKTDESMNASRKGKFTVSIFDPLYSSKKKLEDEEKRYFLNEHDQKLPKSEKPFGDFSILTLNAETKHDLKEKTILKKLITLIDYHHPSIFTLQGVSKNLLDAFQLEVDKPENPHYVITNTKLSSIDFSNNKKEFLPIVFDKRVFSLVSSKFFITDSSPNLPYASFVVLRSVEDKDRIFNVINMNLFSVDSKVADQQLLSIFSHINGSLFKDYPVILAGSLYSMGDLTKKFVKDYFNGFRLEDDKNNSNLSKTTLHYQGEMNDNKEKDFILLHPGKFATDKFKLNYMRILENINKDPVRGTLLEKENSDGLIHYPVYAILSFLDQKGIVEDEIRSMSKITTPLRPMRPMLASN